jgi:hypothetical protein
MNFQLVNNFLTRTLDWRKIAIFFVCGFDFGVWASAKKLKIFLGKINVLVAFIVSLRVEHYDKII